MLLLLFQHLVPEALDCVEGGVGITTYLAHRTFRRIIYQIQSFENFVQDEFSGKIDISVLGLATTRLKFEDEIGLLSLT